MARVTVEDCIDTVQNRFELVLLASHRARLISQGAQITISRDNDKNTVVALREIAGGTLSPDDLKEDMVHSFQKNVEVDEPDSGFSLPDCGPYDQSSEDSPSPAAITFREMSEEELISGINGIVTPDKRDDF